ncbi:hypothetical protein EHS25_004676 [Saitozyma podzolica]|uniref:Uncharacterized protein n=1 Tax=Saitozyma podzolica TaxID=1890683 RepID=A0A427YUR0_9TREE|nr:hypothetical protein EHS25_004676 [Saitozyma podzolica]
MKSEAPPYPAQGNNEKENKQDKKIKKDRKDRKDKKDKQDKAEAAFPTALAAIPEGSVEFNDGFAVLTAPNGEVYRLEMSTLSQQEIDCLEHGHQRKRRFGCLGIIWGIVFFPGGLLGTYCDSYVQCTHCKTILSEKHCITHRLLHRKSKDGAAKATTTATTTV